MEPDQPSTPATVLITNDGKLARVHWHTTNGVQTILFSSRKWRWGYTQGVRPSGTFFRFCNNVIVSPLTVPHVWCRDRIASFCCRSDGIEALFWDIECLSFVVLKSKERRKIRPLIYFVLWCVLSVMTDDGWRVSLLSYMSNPYPAVFESDRFFF